MANSYIIAIDFGTAYSGYAYDLSSKPQMYLWRSGHGLTANGTPKTPTCILFNELQEFIKFGYEAKMEYSTMTADKARENYLFENFKMELYDKTIHKGMTISAKNGKSMDAMKVISECLRYLKDHALKHISEQNGKPFIASDFTWVLTLPAIWPAAAKQFMREAATQAGLVKESHFDRLILCLEPEAASIWSMQLSRHEFDGEGFKDNLAPDPGTQYMVVDCGGGTIDVTVHEVLPGGKVKELHKASGNAMGGEEVDKKFKTFLQGVFSNVWDEFEKYHPSDVQKMMHTFSLAKGKDDQICLVCPSTLIELTGKLCNIGSLFIGLNGASWNRGVIRISKEMKRSFFDDSLRETCKSIRDILDRDFMIEYILLVGGFAASKVLKSHIKEKFNSDQCKVLCPKDPQPIIVLGAVMFGKNPKVVESRVSGLTYGVGISLLFDPSKHKPGKKNGKWCKDVFSKLVTKGESVGCDEVRDYSFTPKDGDQTRVRFAFYSTKRKNAEYVDDYGLQKIGTCDVSTPCLTGGATCNVRLEIRFGSTEMQATATNINTSETVRVTLDFYRG